MARRAKPAASLAPPDPREQAIDQAFAALRRTMGAIHGLQHDAAEGELTKAQGIMLRIIGFAGEVTPKELAQRFGLTAASITSALNRLEAQGLVRRARSDEDRRVVLVSLTAKGQHTLERVEEDTRNQVALLFDGWRVQDIETLQHLLEKLAARAREC